MLLNISCNRTEMVFTYIPMSHMISMLSLLESNSAKICQEWRKVSLSKKWSPQPYPLRKNHPSLKIIVLCKITTWLITPPPPPNQQKCFAGKQISKTKMVPFFMYQKLKNEFQIKSFVKFDKNQKYTPFCILY